MQDLNKASFKSIEEVKPTKELLMIVINYIKTFTTLCVRHGIQK